jgi:hypothetical protein
MRCLASSLAFFCALSLHAESPKLAPPDPAQEQQTLDNIKQFAITHLDRNANLSCTQIGAPSSSKVITIELSAGPAHRGTASAIDTGVLLEDVFATSNGTEFQFDHWGTIRGKQMAAYRYSNHLNGKTHAGLVYADENGAISRITFRGADAPAHLFCSANSR